MIVTIWALGLNLSACQKIDYLKTYGFILGPERENWIRAKYIARAFVRIDALKVDNEKFQGKKKQI